MANAIEIRNLKKTYGDFTLSIDSLIIPCGCIMGLVGSNGAGKSTMIKSILDLIRTDSGEITINGMSNKLEASREDVGVVFDEIKFSQVFTAADVRLILKGVYRNWDDALWEKYIEKFKLPLKKKLKEYSRGMKMKLSLAAALAHHPKLLILDEATSSIDTRTEALVQRGMDSLMQGRTTFVIAHRLSTVRNADQIIVLDHGHIIEHGTHAELLAHQGKYYQLYTGNELTT